MRIQEEHVVGQTDVENVNATNYLDALAERAPAFKGVAGVTKGEGNKAGSSSAVIKRTEDGLAVEQGGRKVTIQTADESFDSVLLLVKGYWRGHLRGPKLVDRTH